MKSVAYNVGATTLMSAFKALRSADGWPCGTPSDVPMFTMRADVACDRPAPRPWGPVRCRPRRPLWLFRVERRAAAQPVVATVWPRGPKRRMEGPVNNVPNVDAQPAAAANRPHCAAPHCLNSRAKTCQKSPMPLVSDCKSTTAFKRANRGLSHEQSSKRERLERRGPLLRCCYFEAGRVSGANEHQCQDTTP